MLTINSLITERSTGDFSAGNKKKVMVLLQAKPLLKLSSWDKFYQYVQKEAG